MKFLVDAHLPPGLCRLLRDAGHDVLHTIDLPGQNLTPDIELNERSFTEQRALITKDTDFYYSHILHGKPWKLILLRTGNLKTGKLLAMFERQLPAILQALEEHSLIELYREHLRTSD